MFHVYHHNDFDGIATAAIFSRYLSLKGMYSFEEFEFHAVDYHLKDSWLKQPLQKPNAVLDFLYHPESDWWFDHHSSTFLSAKSLESPYTHTAQQYWNIAYDSCPSLFLAHLHKYDRKAWLELKAEFKGLVYWSDVIDGANYTSPSDLFGFKNHFLNINKVLGIGPSPNLCKSIIHSLFINDRDVLANNPTYQELLNKAVSIENYSIDVIRELIEIHDEVAFFDQSAYIIPFQRYTAYYLYPDISFRVGIYKKDKKYSISVNYNAWLNKRNTINLGSLCRRLGGGGRFDVGGILTDSHTEALNKSKKLLGWLVNANVKQLALF